MHTTPNLTSIFKVRSAESAKLIPSHWFRSANSDTFKLQHTTEFLHFLDSFLYNVLIVRLPCILLDPLPSCWTCLCLMYINNVSTSDTHVYQHFV